MVGINKCIVLPLMLIPDNQLLLIIDNNCTTILTFRLYLSFLATSFIISLLSPSLPRSIYSTVTFLFFVISLQARQEIGLSIQPRLNGPTLGI